MKEWAKIYTKLDYFRPIIEGICKYHELTFQVINNTYPGTSAVFSLDETYVIKLFPHFLLKDYQTEVSFLNLIKNKYIPNIYFNGYKDDYAYIIMEYKSGHAIRDVQVDEEDLLKIYHELAIVLKDIHLFSDRNSYYIEFINKRKSEVLVELKELFSQNVIDEINDLIGNYQPSTSLVLTHADLNEDHVFVKKVNEHYQLDAIIDFADSKIAEVEYEWIPIYYGLMHRNNSHFKKLLAYYDMEVDHKRMLIYTFLHQFSLPILRDTLSILGKPVIHTLHDLDLILFEGGF